MSDVISIAKLAVQVVSTVSVGKVINDVIRNNVTILNQTDTVKVAVGSLVLGSIVTDHTIKHVNGYMDRAIAWNEERKTTLSVVE